MYMPRFAGHVDYPAPSPTPIDLPGPTGESNRLTTHARGAILCLGPDIDAQTREVLDLGGRVMVHNRELNPGDLIDMECAAVVWHGDIDTARAYEKALAQRDGAIVPLITGPIDAGHVLHERQICVDTTAAGGNAALLAEVGGA